MTRVLIVVLLLNAVIGGLTILRALENQAFLYKSVRAQAWILWDSGAVDFARRDTAYGFLAPVPTNRDEFAEFMLMGSVERQDRVVKTAMVWLGVSSAGLLGAIVWSAKKGKRPAVGP